MKWAKQTGFTIVELIVVIVIIALLIAITTVVYNGVQRRGYDVSVMSDLTHIADEYELYNVNNKVYPYGTVLNNGTAFTLAINKDAYDTSRSFQLLNCTSSTSAGTDYAVLAVSKSGKRFYISSVDPRPTEYTGAGTWLETSNCATVLPGSSGNGAGYSSGTWRDWIRSS